MARIGSNAWMAMMMTDVYVKPVISNPMNEKNSLTAWKRYVNGERLNFEQRAMCARNVYYLPSFKIELLNWKQFMSHILEVQILERQLKTSTNNVTMILPTELVNLIWKYMIRNIQPPTFLDKDISTKEVAHPSFIDIESLHRELPELEMSQK